jgi:hypothetical protein
VLQIFITLKNSSPWPCSNPKTLGQVASTLITTPPRQLVVPLDSAESDLRATVVCVLQTTAINKVSWVTYYFNFSSTAYTGFT